MKAILIDREGTLIVDPLFDRVDAVNKVIILPHTIRGLSLLAANGFSIVIITNQTNIAQGRITLEEFWQINEYVIDLLKPSGVKVLKTYVCPHNSIDNCDCRKPKPMMLEDAINEFDLERSHAYMVGDRLSDIEAGLNARLKTVFVKTGKQPVAIDRLNSSYVADDLLDAASYIVAN